MFKDLQTSLSTIFKSKEVKDKIFFSLLILLVFRMLASIPVVGITADQVGRLFEGVSLGDQVSLLTGGVLETASVIAIGIGPYISASIVVQLMGSVIPKLEELKKDGTQGQRILSMYTRYLSVPLAIMQSFVIYSSLRGFGYIEALPAIQLVGLIATLTGGAMLTMWIAEVMGESGLTNGSSYIIFLGILSGIFTRIASNLELADPLEMVMFYAVFFLIIAATVFVTESEKRIQVTYSRRLRASGNQDNYVPIKLTQFGVMPVIFAASLMTFPIYIAQLLASQDFNEKVTSVSNNVITTLNDTAVQNYGTFFMVIIFSFFYITVVFNPKDIAENLQRQGAFIPGIRPGNQTEKHLRTIAYRLTLFGSFFLAILAVLPNVLNAYGLTSQQVMGGTGLLIVVGVVLDIRRKIQSLVISRSYDKYI